jgi:hypothetical protein
VPKQYAVGISYAGAHRTLVHTVANYLNGAIARLDGTVFLDLYDHIKFVGKVDDELKAVYRDQCELTVAFHSREYFESEWCKMEWGVLKELMADPFPRATQVLVFQLDRIPGERVPGYVSMDVQSKTAEQIAGIILEKMNVTPWIVDARYARKVLSAMKLDRAKRERADWQLEHRIHDMATGLRHVGPKRTDWLPLGLAELCRGRSLKWPEDGGIGLPKNIIYLCGPNGAGKSVLLLRAVASVGMHVAFPEHSWILDFSNNGEACLDAREFESLPSSELKRFLKNTLQKDKPSHFFLGVDGLDSAARHLSVGTNGKTAPVIVMRTLRSLAATLGELSRDSPEPLTITLLVSFNAPRPAAALGFANGETAKHGTWEWMYEKLARAGALFADLEPLPPVDDRTFDEIYAPMLNLTDSGVPAMGRYIDPTRTFLQRPLFLDAAWWVDGNYLSDANTRVDFLRLAEEAGRVSEWPNEIDQLAGDLDRFIHAISYGPKIEGWLKTMLQREWTGGWLELLTEAMAQDSVAGAMLQLMHTLVDERRRWETSASYALSNVLTALCDADRPPRLQTQMRYCNLQRANLDRVVFGPQSVLFGVDCSGSSLNQVKFEDGCRFIATDFTRCTWDSKPERGAPGFVECAGLWEPETKQS